MRSIENIENDLKASVTSAIIPIQTTRTVVSEALQELTKYAIEGAYALKGKALLPRSFLNEIYASAKILHNESEYNKHPMIKEVSNRLFYIFDLILLGETPDDRKPGVPRII